MAGWESWSVTEVPRPQLGGDLVGLLLLLLQIHPPPPCPALGPGGWTSHQALFALELLVVVFSNGSYWQGSEDV